LCYIFAVKKGRKIMKTGMLLSLTVATIGLLALATPAHAQQRGRSGGNAGASGARGGMQTGMNRGGMQPGFNRGGTVRGGNFHGGNRFRGRFFGGNRVNFYFGGLGYPYYFGYPYYYGYGYPYAPYGYYPVVYNYDPQGIYTGRVVAPGNRRNRVQSEGKDQASLEARVQEQLSQAGYYHGAIDGIVGEGTRRAIRSYERANGLRVDGQIDDQLLASMDLG
jgi:hypothetical protein